MFGEAGRNYSMEGFFYEGSSRRGSQIKSSKHAFFDTILIAPSRPFCRCQPNVSVFESS
jgi:hypothetical protein